MPRIGRLFNMKKIISSFILSTLFFQPLAAAESVEIKKNPASLYKDIFDHNVYYDNTAYLRLDRLGRLLSGKKVRSYSANVYDEVADGPFFTNRHSRTPLSGAELTKGYQENSGPDLSGSLKITGGQLEGLRPLFVVQDSKGDEYTLYFDAPDSLGLMTGAMMVASRAYYAVGYNVPQLTLVSISPEQLVPAEDSKFVDVSGFRKKLTKEKLDELVLMLPWAEDGKFRACALKTPKGEDKGPFNFQGRRKNDPQDIWPHQHRRELRAVRVFASWLNDFSVRDSNTRSFLVKENAKPVLKNYLWGFTGALGSDTEGAKVPMLGHEYLYDAAETSKAFWSFGFWEKPWQKRWRENEETTQAPAVGYFDNKELKAGKFKTFVPQYAFKDLTRADGFWAAKILKSFSDEQIKNLVEAGQYADPADAELIVKMLVERRDLIASYWFSQSAPLDSFEVKGGELVFEDLANKYGFETGTSYQVEAASSKKKSKKTAFLNVQTPSVKLDPSWKNQDVCVWIHKVRASSGKQPTIKVCLESGAVAGIQHAD